MPWLIDAWIVGDPPKTFGRQVSLVEGHNLESMSGSRDSGEDLQVAVEVNHADRTILADDAAEERERDRVVAAEGNDAW